MSNFNYNHVQLAGRITKDTELKSTESGNVLVNFTIAIRENQDKSVFINCTAWGEKAKFIHQWFTKGDAIWLYGRLDQRTYETSDGKKHTTIDVYVLGANFIDSKSEKKVLAEQPPVEELKEVDELPF